MYRIMLVTVLGGVLAQGHVSQSPVPEHTFGGHNKHLLTLAFSPDGKMLAAGGPERVIRIFALDTGKEVMSFDKLNGTVMSVSFSPDGKDFLAGVHAAEVKVWDVATWKERFTINSPADIWRYALFSKDSLWIYSTWWPVGERVAGIAVWSNNSGVQWSRLETKDAPLVEHLALANDGKLAVAAGGIGEVLVWDLEKKELLRKWRSISDARNKFTGMALTGDGKTLLIMSSQPSASLWNTSTGELLSALETKLKSPLCARYSPDGKLLVIAGEDGSLEFWSTDKPSRMGQVKVHSGAIRCLTFSADGKLLATGSDDKSVKVWELLKLMPNVGR